MIMYIFYVPTERKKSTFLKWRNYSLFTPISRCIVIKRPLPDVLTYAHAEGFILVHT